MSTYSNRKVGTDFSVYFPVNHLLRASVSAVIMSRALLVTNVNLCTGTSPLTLLMDAPVRHTTNTHTHTITHYTCVSLV